MGGLRARALARSAVARRADGLLFGGHAATSEVLDSARRPGGGPSKPRVTPKQCGANSWSAAYRELHRRNAPPRSWLTPRHAKGGRRAGRQGACSAWVLLQHTPDCRCVDGTVTLRVVVQNTGAADIVRVEVDDCSLSWLVAEANDNANAILRAAGARELQGREHAVAVPRTGTILECKLVARGHERRSSEGFGYLGFAWLQPLEWVAMEVRVATEDCVHEHDFLERAIQLCVKARLLIAQLGVKSTSREFTSSSPSSTTPRCTAGTPSCRAATSC